MNQSDWESCYLLHQRSYGETSLIVDIFSYSYGRISLVAKGAKKPKSKFFGYLMPFNKLKITFSGRGNLKTLTNIDKDLSTNINLNSTQIYSLMYINELIVRLLPQEIPQEDLFKLYDEFIYNFANEKEVGFNLRQFELDLLELLGYGINFNNDIENNELIDPLATYEFVEERGIRKKTNADCQGKDIINMSQRDFSSIPPQLSKNLTKMAINFCLDGKQINSREIFKPIKET